MKYVYMCFWFTVCRRHTLTHAGTCATRPCHRPPVIPNKNTCTCSIHSDINSEEIQRKQTVCGNIYSAYAEALACVDRCGVYMCICVVHRHCVQARWTSVSVAMRRAHHLRHATAIARTQCSRPCRSHGPRRELESTRAATEHVTVERSGQRPQHQHSKHIRTHTLNMFFVGLVHSSAAGIILYCISYT